MTIGLATTPDRMPIAREFFELFKTPWEPAVPGRTYPVVIASGVPIDQLEARVFIVFGADHAAIDRTANRVSARRQGPLHVRWDGSATFPVYHEVALPETMDAEITLTATDGSTVAYRWSAGDSIVHRIGYDLFDEIRTLLRDGQPAPYAPSPTLERHIALLRRLLDDSGVAFVEIPPVPSGFDFICCLTHDIDFHDLRRHVFDRTMAGFLLRGTIGTLADLVRGRRTLAEALSNWSAVATLPLVFLGVLRDPWRPFDDYDGTDPVRRSTFFVIPYKGRAGRGPDGAVRARRAAPYGIADIRSEVLRAARRGVELAVHGIDAWRDAGDGGQELRKLTTITGQTTVGVRMHWLYFTPDSPRHLEAAGFDYDSTCGYNDAVGFRAGTLQAFRPPGATTLLELPLSIMDSALFAPARMHLDRSTAQALCRDVVEHARRFGGALVVNWHDRSLAPERLWGASYRALLREVSRDNRAWFTTAGSATRWFRWRRSVTFVRADDDPARVHVEAPPIAADGGGGVIRMHRPNAAIAEAVLSPGTRVDIDLRHATATTIPALPARSPALTGAR